MPPTRVNSESSPAEADEIHDYRTKRNPLDAFLATIGSFHIAVVLFAFMIIVTFVGTWYQKEFGLYDCQRWYFESWITPEEAWVWGWLPLPGMALLFAVMFVNVLAGGVIRIRKNKYTIGVVISHFSMLGFIIAGAVSLWTKTEGNLRVNEGEANSIVVANHDSVIEVRELTDTNGNPPASTDISFFSEKLFRDCTDGTTRDFFRREWPFELRVGNYVRNAVAAPAGDPSLPLNAAKLGDYALRPLKVSPFNEQNMAGVKIDLMSKSGTLASALIAGRDRQPFVAEVGGRRFSFAVTRERWELPYSIKLIDFRAIYYPGTRKAKSYESDIAVLHQGGRESKHHISMNNPLRDSGYIAFQTNFDHDSPPGQEKYSDFTVVKNQSDQWPLYSLIVCTIGLVLHFGLKLFRFLDRNARRQSIPTAAAHESP